jgi:hypothetical protein
MPGQLKAVVPAKLNVDAMMGVLQTEFEKYAPFLVKSFERTTTNWQGEKPVFSPIIKGSPKSREMVLQIRVVGPEKGRKKWKWLNEGTSPHVIKPKGPYPLRFRTGYQAGSKPKQLFTIRGSASGDEVRAMEVHHPGFPAREWSDLIIKEHQDPFRRWMDAAMGHAARASGHAMK